MESIENYKGTILIVDDNPMNLGILFESLIQNNFKVIIAEDGEKALALAERSRPDIILLDIMMPGIDGFETCRRLKENESTKDIPIIFLTALSDTEDKIKGFHAGGVDYITKPLRQEEVMARINTHLTIRTLQRELKEQNVVLQQKNEELRISNLNKDRFFSIISHDLKNPFTSFLMGTELLMDARDLAPTRIEHVAESLNQAAIRMKELLENLLHWSRMKMGSMDYDPENIDLKIILIPSISLLESNLMQKSVRIVNEIPDEIFVNVDPNMINTVFRNVLTNGWKFTPPGGMIHISSREVDHFLEVSVSDTGIGMSSDEIKKLFRIDEKFQRKGTEGEEGTGLGLILCKELIEKHGGQIWVESEIGKGSTFRFTIPLASSREDK